MTQNDIKTHARRAFKELSGRVPLQWADRVVRNAVTNQTFAGLEGLREFHEREPMWGHLFTEILDPTAPVTYLEFGVYKGESINQIATLNEHPSSVFIGFDTFEGVDVDWVNHDMRAFDVGGTLPATHDPRIKLVKGFFQDTLPGVLADLEPHDQAVIMYDADLYSSTLYTLASVDPVMNTYYAIFDEFHGGENLALANYVESFMATNEMLGKATGAATQVISRITTHTPGA